jgi:hypothetical protein
LRHPIRTNTEFYGFAADFKFRSSLDGVAAIMKRVAGFCVRGAQ